MCLILQLIFKHNNFKKQNIVTNVSKPTDHLTFQPKGEVSQWASSTYQQSLHLATHHREKHQANSWAPPVSSNLGGWWVVGWWEVVGCCWSEMMMTVMTSHHLSTLSLHHPLRFYHCWYFKTLYMCFYKHLKFVS